MKKTIKNKLPKLYWIIFLCCSKSKQKKEAYVEEYTSKKVQPYLNHLEDLIEYFESRREMYRAGHIPREDEGFKKLLSQGTMFVRDIKSTQWKEAKINVEPSPSFVTVSDMAAVKVDIPLPSRKRLRPNARTFKSGIHKLAEAGIIMISSTQPLQSQVGPSDVQLSRVESDGNEEETLDF